MKIFNSGAIGISLPSSTKAQESTGATPTPLDDGCNQWLATYRSERVAKDVLATMGSQEGDAAQVAASCHFELFANR